MTDDPARIDGGGTPPAFRLVTLTGSYEGFGVTMDYLSRLQPFAGYDLGNFSRAVREQLTAGRHVAALDGPKLAGYCGWLTTDRATAERWANDGGPLVGSPGPHDAVALTVVAADNRRILTALIRHARKLNPDVRVFFKREYSDPQRRARKSAVDNRGGV